MAHHGRECRGGRGEELGWEPGLRLLRAARVNDLRFRESVEEASMGKHVQQKKDNSRRQKEISHDSGRMAPASLTNVPKGFREKT
jgi:hypothetical protein